MAFKKCLKCGADVPDVAEFCPSCGAPKGAKAVTQPAAQPVQPVQPQQPVYQQQMMVKQGDPLKNLAKTVFSTKMMVIFIMIGLLLIFIGMFLWTFGYPGYEHEFKSDGDVKDYNESFGMLRWASLLSSIGFFILAAILLCGGILNNTLPPYVRLGLLFAGAWLLAAALTGSTLDPGNFLPWSSSSYSGGYSYPY